MNININEFKEILKKATLNFSLDSVQLNLTKDRIETKMATNSNDAIAMLNVENKVLDMAHIGEYQFNFQDPNQSILPFLNLMEGNDFQPRISIGTEKITMVYGNQKSVIYFCSPFVVSTFTRSSVVREGTDDIIGFNISEDFIKQYLMIKKIGMRFNKVYFGVEGKKFFMETTDRTNKFSNGLRFEMADIEYDNMSICFDYKNFINVLSSIGSSFADFTMKILFVKQANLGMINFTNLMDTEKYYLMSKADS